MNSQDILIEINSDANYTQLRQIIAQLLSSLNASKNNFENIKICRILMNEKYELLTYEERSEVYYILAKNTYYKKDLDTAKMYCINALEIMNKNFENANYKSKVSYLYTILYNLLATIEAESGLLIEGIRDYGLAYEKSILNKDTNLKNTLLSNMATTCVYLGLYQKALDIFSIAKENILNNFNPNQEYLYTTLANIYLYEAISYANLDRIDEAKKAMQNISNYVNPNDDEQFKHYYYNLQSLIKNREGNFKEADQLFDKVFKYFIKNEHADKTLEIINTYLKEYFKRENPDIDYLYELKEGSNQSLIGWKNFYFMSSLKFYDMKMLTAKNNKAEFESNYTEYKKITKNANKKYLEQYVKSIQDQYEYMLAKKESKNYEKEKSNYVKNTQILEKEKQKYKKYSERLNFINELVGVLESNKNFEDKLSVLKNKLSLKIDMNKIAIAVFDKKTKEVSFMIVDKQDNIHKFKRPIEQVSDELVHNFKSNYNEAIIIKTATCKKCIKELSEGAKELLIFKLFDNDRKIGLSILFSKKEKEFTKEEIFIYESFTPYFASELQKQIIKIEIQKVLQEKHIKAKELAELNKKVLFKTNLDKLTAVPNKAHFHSRSMQLYRKSIEDKSPLCFLSIDIDNFKSYNLAYGYRKGDETIKKIAQALYQVYKDCDFLNEQNSVFARYARDFFVLMFVDYDNIELDKIALQLIEKVDSLKIEHLASEHKYLSIGIGASCLKEYQDYNIQKLFDYTQKLLTIAKMKGENSYVIDEFKPETNR